MPKKVQALGEKHWEALRLIEEGRMSLKDIAKTLGWSSSYFYDLHEGKENCGRIGELFKSELAKQEKKNQNKIKTLTADNKKLALQLLNDFLRQTTVKGISGEDEAKTVSTVFNALAKASPSVEIGSLQYNYTKGLNAEELVHEFTKLKSLAEGASKRGGVQASGSGAARVLSALAESTG